MVTACATYAAVSIGYRCQIPRSDKGVLTTMNTFTPVTPSMLYQVESPLHLSHYAQAREREQKAPAS